VVIAVPKIFQMPKRDATNTPKASVPPPDHSPLVPLLPDTDEEHASVAKINRWVSLADAVLGISPQTRKRA